MAPMRKLIATVTVAAALGGGVFAISSVLPASAQSGPGSQTQPADAGGHRGRAKAALDKLVAGGIITQGQEDAVISALKGATRDGRLRPKVLRQVAEVSADAIGISVEELEAGLKSGKSIAQIAAERGVSVDSVKQALVTKATARINTAVSTGQITQQRADKILAELPALVERIVNRQGGKSLGTS